MLLRHANLISSLILMWDVVCLQFVWTIARLHVHNLEKAASVFDGWHVVLLGVLWLASAWLFRVHSDPSWHRIGDRVRNLVAAVSFFVGIAVGSWSLSGDPPPLSTFPVFWIVTLAAVAGARATALSALRLLTARGMNRRNLLIVGTGTSAREVVNRLHAVPEYGCVARGFLSESPGEVGRVYEQVPVIGTFRDLPRLVESEIDLVVLCLPAHLEAQADKLLHELRNSTVDVKLIPSLAQTDTLGLEAYMFEGLPMITLQAARVQGWDRALKRTVDILGASCALLLSAPVWLVIALAIKVSSRGPVLYRQTRMSLAGQPFVMLKFRTMHVQAEHHSGPVWTSPPGDPRVTGIGRLLRRTSLDELPQLWNVLKGDMSLVGPRPERPPFIEAFRQAYPAYMLRLKVKAGITGWAQINGWRGDTCLHTRIAHDLYYIEHWSLWFDLKILYQTLWKSVVHEHSS
jgi:exopolysaccharide biosynthesis polyprenyl glycosylphosphotransferase